MSEIDPHQITDWVNQAGLPPVQKELRQAVHTILAAIAQDAYLREHMVMKGGILLAIQYHSVRFTTDIDFSTPLKLAEVDPKMVEARMTAALSLMVEALPYDLDSRVQSCKLNPPNRPEASFPSIDLKIGYAYKGSPKYLRLQKLQSPSVVSIDYSLNEVILEMDSVRVRATDTITAYGLADLVAEKFRALLQQPIRNRYRRQDIYDLYMLSTRLIDESMKGSILRSFMMKSRARDIEPTPDSMDDREVKSHAAEDYQTLENEVLGELPDFDTAYAAVVALYQSLPWPA